MHRSTGPRAMAARACAALLLTGCGGQLAQQGGDDTGLDVEKGARMVFEAQGVRWVDLTHTLDEHNVFWPTARQFDSEVVSADTTEAGYWYAANNFCTAEHGGTHLDAPYHFAENGWATHEVPIEALRGPAAVIDVREQARADRDYRVQVSDLQRWEAEHGRLPEGAMVLINSGWQQYWPDAEQVLGTAARGEEATDELHFPGLHRDAARWLVENRDVNLVGLDTPSIDYGQSEDFMSHRILYEANVPGLENVANLDELPPSGAYALVLPIKIRGGSGGQARVVGIVPEESGVDGS